MFKIALSLALIGFVSAYLHSTIAESKFEPAWQQWKSKYSKIYGSVAEEVHRFNIWKKNVEMINHHNFEHSMGLHTYTMEINSMGDLTREEYASIYLGAKVPSKLMGDKWNKTNPYLPSSIDWRTKGCVTPVKNQGQCGSCWAFSSTGSAECSNFQKHGKLLSFSEQELVDCVSQCHGCNGGFYTTAWDWAKSNGFELESDYPYTAKDGSCHAESSKFQAHVASFSSCLQESGLKQCLGTLGVVSVAIDASHQSFQFYKNGVYNDPACSSTQIDHAVLAVGYGHASSGGDYWLVKNSWGTSWGLEGYIQIQRAPGVNRCAIESYGYHVVLA